VDFRLPDRVDMSRGSATEVDFVQADISSAEATEKAFSKPWDASVAHLPLTVFHTAAVIVPSDRSKLVVGFRVCEAVNVRGTQHVVDAARRAGADVLVSTTSGSISIRPVELWMPPWRLWSRSSCWPRHYWQVLDEKDFFEPPRSHEEFYANYPASKAAAERIVCAANSKVLRTGCIRPANGVYGNPTDNTVGGALAKRVLPT
jgi:nucleoside-diphosphate-sugar epimerase